MRRVLVIGPGGSGKSTFKLLNEKKASKKIVWLRSNTEVEQFLENPEKS